jgi:surface carbohydrate biosynthesis protein
MAVGPRDAADVDIPDSRGRVNQPRVALIVDHPQRDLAGLVLTAHALCQRGVVCHLVPLNLQASELWALAPDFVLLNFLRRGTMELGRQLAATGIRFGLLDTEGAVWTEPERYAELLWDDPALLHLAQPACMWGPRLAEYLVEHELLAPEQIAVTGCPRFDLYDPAWRSVVCEASRAVSARQRLLINTNFSLTNGRFVSRERNIEQVREVLGWSDAYIEEIVRGEEQALAEMIELARRLARDYPQLEVVLRPHPFEDPAPYERGVGGLTNVTLNTTGPVQPQILSAAAVIQRSCSTAIEAGLASVPALSPQWVPAPIPIPMSEASSVPCNSYDEMRAVVEAILAGTYRMPDGVRCAIDAVVADWFHRTDGSAHERVRDAVVAALDGRRMVDERQCARYLYGLDTPRTSLGDRLAREVRYHARLSPDWSFRQFRTVPSTSWAQTDKFFGVDDVRALVARIEQAQAARGATTKRVVAASARERGDYQRDQHGFAVTMTCA